jgi:hypothetical protein
MLVITFISLGNYSQTSTLEIFSKMRKGEFSLHPSQQKKLHSLTGNEYEKLFLSVLSSKYMLPEVKAKGQVIFWACYF